MWTRLAEWFKAPDLRSGLCIEAWVRTPHLVGIQLIGNSYYSWIFYLFWIKWKEEVKSSTLLMALLGIFPRLVEHLSHLNCSHHQIKIPKNPVATPHQWFPTRLNSCIYNLITWYYLTLKIQQSRRNSFPLSCNDFLYWKCHRANHHCKSKLKRYTVNRANCHIVNCFETLIAPQVVLTSTSCLEE